MWNWRWNQEMFPLTCCQRHSMSLLIYCTYRMCCYLRWIIVRVPHQTDSLNLCGTASEKPQAVTLHAMGRGLGCSTDRIGWKRSKWRCGYQDVNLRQFVFQLYRDGDFHFEDSVEWFNWFQGVCFPPSSALAETTSMLRIGTRWLGSGFICYPRSSVAIESVCLTKYWERWMGSWSDSYHSEIHECVICFQCKEQHKILLWRQWHSYAVKPRLLTGPEAACRRVSEVWST